VKTDKGFLTAERLSTADFVACPTKMLPSSCSLPKEELTLIGLMLGDGCNVSSFIFCAGTEDKVQLFKECASSVFRGCRFSVLNRCVRLLSCADRKTEVLRFARFCQDRGINLAKYFKSNTARLLRGDAGPSFETMERIEKEENTDLRSFKNSLCANRMGFEWLVSLGMAGTRSAEKRVPVAGYNEEQAAALLLGLFMTDGYIGLTNEVSYSTASIGLNLKTTKALSLRTTAGRFFLSRGATCSRGILS
jgi:hypothetical protein